MAPDFSAQSSVLHVRNDEVKSLYRKLFGNYLYLARCTLPDISYTVGVFCREAQDKTWEYWNIVNEFLRNLSETKEYGIEIGGTNSKNKNSIENTDEFETYSNAD